MGGELLSHMHTERGSLHSTKWIFLHVVIFFQFCLCVSSVKGSEVPERNPSGWFASKRGATLPPCSSLCIHSEICCLLCNGCCSEVVLLCWWLKPLEIPGRADSFLPAILPLPLLQPFFGPCLDKLRLSFLYLRSCTSSPSCIASCLSPCATWPAHSLPLCSVPHAVLDADTQILLSPTQASLWGTWSFISCYLICLQLKKSDVFQNVTKGHKALGVLVNVL